MSESLSGRSLDVHGDMSELSAERSLLDHARIAAHEILRTTENPLSREIAEKILAKVEIKQRIDSMVTHANDVTVYEEFKKLGIFVVRDAQAAFDYRDKEVGLDLRKGDRYLDLHLPPVPGHLRSRGAVEESPALVNRYASFQNLQPKYLMGVTYERMARLAERQFGFNVAYPDPHSLPDDVVGGVQRVFEGFTEAGINGDMMGVSAIVFREMDITNNSAHISSVLGGLVVRHVELGMIPPAE